MNSPEKTVILCDDVAHTPRTLAAILARDSEQVLVLGAGATLSLPTDPNAALPDSFVWMPAGTHAINAHTVGGGTFSGKVICDEQAARSISESFARITATGSRVWLDFDHDDGEASAWVKAFTWDASRGIIAHVEWSAKGAEALRGKAYYSFSPAFAAEKDTGRIVSLLSGHAAGGLVNAPAFKAMPALIAARVASIPAHQPAPGGQSEQKPNMNELLIKILAALNVQAPANATEEQLVSLVAKSLPSTPSAEIVALKKQIDEAQLAAVNAKKASDEKIAQMEQKMTENLAAVTAAASRVSVSQPDIADVLAGYIAKDPAQLPANRQNEILRAELSMERALIWARDIAPLVKKDSLHGVVLHAEKNTDNIAKIAAKRRTGVINVQAANALGTLAGSLIAQNSLSLLKAQLPAFSMFSTDFSNASAKLNQSIISRLRTIPTVQTYNTTTGYAKSDVTATDVPVSIANHKYTQFAYNANELASTGRDLFAEQAEGAVYALGKDMLDTALALFLVAAYPGRTIVTQSNFNRAAVIAARVALRKRKVQINQDNGFILANEDYFGNLAQDATIVNLATYQRPELITEYMLPKIAGFTPMAYVDLPTTNFLTAIIGVKECVLVAARLPYDYVDAQIGANYGAVSQITDPNTGLSVMLTQYVNHDLGNSNYRLALMSGSAVGDGARAQLIASA
jgi:hypothetical protein